MRSTQVDRARESFREFEKLSRARDVRSSRRPRYLRYRECDRDLVVTYLDLYTLGGPHLKSQQSRRAKELLRVAFIKFANTCYVLMAGGNAASA